MIAMPMPSKVGKFQVVLEAGSHLNPFDFHNCIIDCRTCFSSSNHDLRHSGCSLGIGLFKDLFSWHIYLWTIYAFSNCLLGKVCCGALIFAARRPWNWTVGPKVILNLGKYIPIFRDGGIFGTMLCIKGGPPPLRPPSSDTFFVGGGYSDVCGLLINLLLHQQRRGQGPHPQFCGCHMRYLEASVLLNLYKRWAFAAYNISQMEIAADYV